MLRHPPTNLNKQAQDATILLIREVLAKGITLTEVYVDALGNTTTYEAYLSRTFPGISFTVTQKADSKFKIVGAASVAAKVTRDACIEGWFFPETEDGTSSWGNGLGSGYPSGVLAFSIFILDVYRFVLDPNTQAWLRAAVDPTFGFPDIVRFSWTTVKVLLDKHGNACQWWVSSRSIFSAAQLEIRTDEGQASLIKAFESGTGLDKGRCAVTRDLQIHSVDTL